MATLMRYTSMTLQDIGRLTFGQVLMLYDDIIRLENQHGGR